MSMAPRSRSTSRTLLSLLAVVTLMAACDDGPSAPSEPETQTIAFSTRLQPGAFAWRSVAVDKAGAVSVQLVAISPSNDAIVSLAFGRFENNACTPITTIETAPGSAPQISTTAAVGTYCVRVADIGNLTSDWTFSIAIVIPN